jgi:small multidrug resistance pump
MVIALALLMTAIGCEVGATAVIPRTDSFHNPGWSVLVVLGYAVATWLLSVVVKTLPLGVTYATWAGLGTVLVAAVGVIFQGESISPVKAGAIALIVAGVVALNLGASSNA